MTEILSFIKSYSKFFLQETILFIPKIFIAIQKAIIATIVFFVKVFYYLWGHSQLQWEKLGFWLTRSEYITYGEAKTETRCTRTPDGVIHRVVEFKMKLPENDIPS